MHLTDEDIAKLGRLGRLSLTSEQRQAYAEQLTRIIDYTDRLHAAEVSATRGTLHPARPAQELREDVAVSANAEACVQLAPKREGRFVVSPPLA